MIKLLVLMIYATGISFICMSITHHFNFTSYESNLLYVGIGLIAPFFLKI